jgi:hypothetical protein
VGLLAPLAGVLLFGLAVGAGSLLVAGSVLAGTSGGHQPLCSWGITSQLAGAMIL